MNNDYHRVLNKIKKDEFCYLEKIRFGLLNNIFVRDKYSLI